MPRFRFKTPVFSRLCGFCQLFPLNRCRGLAGDIVHHAVHALHLVGDAGGHTAQQGMDSETTMELWSTKVTAEVGVLLEGEDQDSGMVGRMI